MAWPRLRLLQGPFDFPHAGCGCVFLNQKKGNRAWEGLSSRSMFSKCKVYWLFAKKPCMTWVAVKSGMFAVCAHSSRFSSTWTSEVLRCAWYPWHVVCVPLNVVCRLDVAFLQGSMCVLRCLSRSDVATRSWRGFRCTWFGVLVSCRIACF